MSRHSHPVSLRLGLNNFWKTRSFPFRHQMDAAMYSEILPTVSSFFWKRRWHVWHVAVRNTGKSVACNIYLNFGGWLPAIKKPKGPKKLKRKRRRVRKFSKNSYKKPRRRFSYRYRRKRGWVPFRKKATSAKNYAVHNSVYFYHQTTCLKLFLTHLTYKLSSLYPTFSDFFMELSINLSNLLLNLKFLGNCTLDLINTPHVLFNFIKTVQGFSLKINSALLFLISFFNKKALIGRYSTFYKLLLRRRKLFDSYIKKKRIQDKLTAGIIHEQSNFGCIQTVWSVCSAWLSACLVYYQVVCLKSKNYFNLYQKAFVFVLAYLKNKVRFRHIERSPVINSYTLLKKKTKPYQKLTNVRRERVRRVILPNFKKLLAPNLYTEPSPFRKFEEVCSVFGNGLTRSMKPSSIDFYAKHWYCMREVARQKPGWPGPKILRYMTPQLLYDVSTANYLNSRFCIKFPARVKKTSTPLRSKAYQAELIMTNQFDDLVKTIYSFGRHPRDYYLV